MTRLFAIGLSVLGALFTIILFEPRSSHDADIAALHKHLTPPLDSPARMADPEDARIAKAWAKALKLAKLKDAPPMPNEVIIYNEPRYLAPAGAARLCGWTWRYWIEEPGGKWSTRVTIIVYGEDVVDRTLIHEMLHVLLGYESGRLAEEEEVRAVYPVRCSPNE